jgi:hypothetical protein
MCELGFQHILICFRLGGGGGGGGGGGVLRVFTEDMVNKKFAGALVSISCGVWCFVPGGMAVDRENATGACLFQMPVS